MLESLREQFDEILVFDTETTGISPQRDEIIEFGLLRIDLREPEREWERDILVRLSANRHLPPVITNLTGISEEMLREDGISKLRAAQVLQEFLTADRPLLAAYNAQFDLCFLYYFLKEYGDPGLLRNLKLLDAMTVYKDRREYPHKLKDAVEAYSLKTQNPHRAVDDARATLELLCAMEAERDDLCRYLNLFGYNPKYGVSGAKISSVRYLPQGYRETCPLYEK